MQEHLRIGKYGEGLACLFLKEKGYTILETNWRFSRAEVDIIALKNDVVIFVEVKTRSDVFFGQPEDSINEKKERLLFDAAGAYLDQNDWQKAMRFDIVAIHLKGIKNYKITHFEDAIF